jgi:hypothetical protein
MAGLEPGTFSGVFHCNQAAKPLASLNASMLLFSTATGNDHSCQHGSFGPQRL